MLFKKKINYYKLLIKPLLAVAVFCLILWLGYIAQSSALLQVLASGGGYIGVFFFAFLNGFNVFVPVLTTSFMPVWTSAGLDSTILIILISVAMTMADSVAFFIAKFGGNIITEPKEKGLLARLMKLKEKYDATPLIVLFFWSIFAPLPNEVILIPMGVMNYRVRYILPIILVGNFIFNLGTGLGLISLFQLIG